MLKNLYAMELYKLWKNKRFLLFLFLLLLCNIGFLSYETWGQQGAETTAYQKLSTHLQTLSLYVSAGACTRRGARLCT